MRVWLGRPDAPELMGGLPDGVDADDWDGNSEPPESMRDVEFYVFGWATNRDRVLETIPTLPKLQVVQGCVAGYDRVIKYVPDGVTLCNTPGIHDPSTAEWVVTAMLGMTRQFPKEVLKQASQTQRQYRTDVFIGKTVLILGYGSIGAAVERRLAGFEVEILRVAGRARDNIYGPESLPELLGRAEIVVVLVPSSPETEHLVNAEFLSRMPDGALLVNVARGALVDQDALLAEVRSGRLRAALDVGTPDPLPPNHPLLTTPGVFYTPHQAGYTRLDIPSAYAFIGDQLRRYASGEPLIGVIEH